jgi:hypothetical protein|tara:strand:+ start:1397 stop:1864 length:468 start_codon:yes stop_codon:yes gene_type:complete
MIERLHKDVLSGIKRPINSRKKEILITVEDFNILSDTYFKKINTYQNFKFSVNERDKVNVIFLLRSYYNLWIEIDENLIEIFKDFPKIFIVSKKVTKFNHPHSPEEFDVGTIMYLSASRYNTCNWMVGIPLWKNKNTNLTPGCQINYTNLKPYFK